MLILSKQADEEFSSSKEVSRTDTGLGSPSLELTGDAGCGALNGDSMGSTRG